MDFIQQKIRQLAEQLIKNRKYNYNQDSLYSYLQANTSVNMQQLFIKNKRGQNLDTIILKNSASDTCIIYAHGLGSNKLEMLPLANYFKTSKYHLCAFDFSGSGRSDGDYTTYGLRQQDDINAILAWLDSTRQYDRYILWGRSMGGASIILSQSRNINKKVMGIVLDSPFSSFQRAAIQIASKYTILPKIMLNMIIEPLKNLMRKQFKSLNPFDLDICGAASRIQTRIMLIYSKGDSIVDFTHSKQIGKHCQRNAVQIQIQEDHNKPRKKQTFLEVLKFIKQTIQINQSRSKRSASKGRGISVSSKQNHQPNEKSRKSISSSITSNKFNQTENLVSVGSFVSSSSMSKQNNLKQAFIRSVVLERHEIIHKDSFRNSIKFTNRYRHCSRLL